MATKKADGPAKQERVLQYRATWNLSDHTGIIEVRTAPETIKTFRFDDGGEFGAVAAMLQCDPDVWLIDDKLLSTQVQSTGLPQLKP